MCAMVFASPFLAGQRVSVGAGVPFSIKDASSRSS